MNIELGIYKGEVLDQLLTKGNFRKGNDIFTTNDVYVGNYGNSNMYDQVFWLRLILNKATETKQTKRIRRKCSNFSVAIKMAEITEEVETLYSEYLAIMKFDGYPSCKDCIPELNNEIAAFDTYMIEVRNSDQLIGVGFFDKGQKALMSVLHFYHPNYNKFSIGKYLMLLTKDFSEVHQMDFVYPGYFFIGLSKMDYKIFPQQDAIEVYLPVEEIWEPLSNYTKIQLEEYFFKKIMVIDFENSEVNEQLDATEDIETSQEF